MGDPPRINGDRAVTANSGERTDPTLGQRYTVADGDNLWVILRRAGVAEDQIPEAIDALLALNPRIKHRDLIQPTWQIQLPERRDFDPNAVAFESAEPVEIRTGVERRTDATDQRIDSAVAVAAQPALVIEAPQAPEEILPESSAVSRLPGDARAAFLALHAGTRTLAPHVRASIDAEVTKLIEALAAGPHDTAAEVETLSALHADITRRLRTAGALGPDTLAALENLRDAIRAQVQTGMGLTTELWEARGRVYGLSAEGNVTAPQRDALESMHAMTYSLERQRMLARMRGQPLSSLPLYDAWQDSMRLTFERMISRDPQQPRLTHSDILAMAEVTDVLEGLIDHPEAVPHPLAVQLRQLTRSLINTPAGSLKETLDSALGRRIDVPGVELPDVPNTGESVRTSFYGITGLGRLGRTPSTQDFNESLSNVLDLIKQGLSGPEGADRESIQQRLRDGLLQLGRASDGRPSDDPVLGVYLDLRNTFLRPDAFEAPRVVEAVSRTAETVSQFDVFNDDVQVAMRGLLEVADPGQVAAFDSTTLAFDGGAVEGLNSLGTLFNGVLDADAAGQGEAISNALAGIRDGLGGSTDSLPPQMPFDYVLPEDLVKPTDDGGTLIIPAGARIGTDAEGNYVISSPSILWDTPDGAFHIYSNDDTNGFELVLGDDLDTMRFAQFDVTSDNQLTGASFTELLITGDHANGVTTISADAGRVEMFGDSIEFTNAVIRQEDGGALTATAATLGLSYGGATLSAEDIAFGQQTIDGVVHTDLSGANVQVENAGAVMTAESLVINITGPDAAGAERLGATVTGLNIEQGDFTLSAESGSLDLLRNADGTSRLTLSDVQGLEAASGGTTLETTGELNAVVNYGADGTLQNASLAGDGALIEGAFGNVTLSDGVTFDIVRAPDGSSGTQASVGQVAGTLADGTQVNVLEGSVLVVRGADGNIERMLATSDAAQISGDFGSIALTEGLSVDLIQTDEGSVTTAGVGRVAGTFADGSELNILNGDAVLVRDLDGNLVSAHATADAASFAGDFGQVEISDGMALNIVNAPDGSQTGSMAVGTLAGSLASGEEIFISNGTALIVTDAAGNLLSAQATADDVVFTGDFGSFEMHDGMQLDFLVAPDGTETTTLQAGIATGSIGGTDFTLTDGSAVLVRSAEGTTERITANRAVFDGAYGHVELNDGATWELVSTADGSRQSLEFGEMVVDGAITDYHVLNGSVVVLKDQNGNLTQVFGTADQATITGSFGELTLGEGVSVELVHGPSGEQHLSGQAGTLAGAFSDGTEVFISQGSILAVHDADGNLIKLIGAAEAATVTGDFGSLEITEGLGVQMVREDDGTEQARVQAGHLAGQFGENNLTVINGSAIVITEPDGSLRYAQVLSDSATFESPAGRFEATEGLSLVYVNTDDGEHVRAGIGALDAQLADGTNVQLTGGSAWIVRDPDGGVRAIRAGTDTLRIAGAFGEIDLAEGATAQLVVAEDGTETLQGNFGSLTGKLEDGTAFGVSGGNVLAVRDGEGNLTHIRATADAATITGSFGSVDISEGMLFEVVRAEDGQETTTAAIGRFEGQFDQTAVQVVQGQIVAVRNADGEIQSISAVADSAQIAGSFGEITVDQGLTVELLVSEDGTETALLSAGEVAGQIEGGVGFEVTGAAVLVVRDSTGQIRQLGAAADTLNVRGEFGDVQIQNGMMIDLVTADDGAETLALQVGQADANLADGTAIGVTGGQALVIRNADGAIERMMVASDEVHVTGDFGSVDVTGGMQIDFIVDDDGRETLAGEVGNLETHFDGTELNVVGGTILAVRNPAGEIVHLRAGAQSATLAMENANVQVDGGLQVEILRADDGSEVATAQVGQLRAELAEMGVSVTNGAVMVLRDPDGTIRELVATADATRVEWDGNHVDVSEGMQVALVTADDGTETLGAEVGRLDAQVGETAVKITDGRLLAVRDADGNLMELHAGVESARIEGAFGTIDIAEGATVDYLRGPEGDERLAAGVGQLAGVLEDGTEVNLTGGTALVVRGADGSLEGVVGVDTASVVGTFGEVHITGGGQLFYSNDAEGRVVISAAVGEASALLPGGDSLKITNGWAVLATDGDLQSLRGHIDAGTYEGKHGILNLTGVDLAVVTEAGEVQGLSFSGDVIDYQGDALDGNLTRLHLENTTLNVVALDDGAIAMDFGTQGSGIVDINGTPVHFSELPEGERWEAGVLVNAGGDIEGIDLSLPGRAAWIHEDGRTSVEVTGLEAEAREAGARIKISFDHFAATLASENMEVVVVNGAATLADNILVTEFGSIEARRGNDTLSAGAGRITLDASQNDVFRVRGEGLDAVANLEGTEITLDSGVADVSVDPVNGIVVNEITATVINVRTPEGRTFGVNVEKMRNLAIQAGRFESDDVQSFQLRLVPTGDGSTLTMEAFADLDGKRGFVRLENVDQLLANATVADGFAHAEVDAGDGQVTMGFADLTVTGSNISATYVGLGQEMGGMVLLNDLRRYRTREGARVGPVQVEPDGVVRMGGRLGMVRGEVAMLIRREAGNEPLFMWNQAPDHMNDRAPGLMMTLGIGNERTELNVFAGLTQASYAALNAGPDGDIRYQGQSLGNYVGVPLAAVVGIHARHDKWGLMAGRAESVVGMAGGVGPIEDSAPGLNFVTLDYTDGRFRAALEAAFSDSEIASARLITGWTLGGEARITEDIATRRGQDGFARDQGIDNSRERVDPSQFKPHLEGHVARALRELLGTGDEAALSDERTLAQASAAEVAAIMSERSGQDLAPLFEELHRAGRFDALLRGFDRQQRAVFVDAVLASDASAQVMVDLARTLAAQKRNNLTDLVLARAASDHALGVHLAAAVVLERPARNDSSVRARGARRRHRRATEIMQHHIAATGFDHDRATTAVASGVAAPMLALMVEQDPRALFDLARGDSSAHILGSSNGELFRATVLTLIENRRFDQVYELFYEMPRESLPYHLSSLGAGPAYSLIDRIQDDMGHAGWVDREAVTRLILWPNLRVQERQTLAADIGMGLTEPEAARRAARQVQVLDKITEIEHAFGIRVLVNIDPDQLRSDEDLAPVLAALESVDASRGHAVLELVAEDGNIQVEGYAPERQRPAVVLATQARWIELGLRQHGIEVSDPVTPEVLTANPQMLHGYVELMHYLNSYRNVLIALGISEVRFGSETRIQTLDTRVKAEAESGERVAVNARVLEIDTLAELSAFGSSDPMGRVRAIDNLTGMLGDNAQGARWLIGPFAGTRYGEADVGGTISFQARQGSPIFYANYSDLMGLGIGTRHSARLGDRTGAVLSVGALVDPETGSVGPMAGGRVSHLIFGEPGGDTKLVVTGSALLNIWQSGVGGVLYFEHDTGRHEVQAYVKATMMEWLQGGPHIRAQLRLFHDSPVYPIIGVGTRLGPFVGVGIGQHFQIKGGPLGVGIAITKKLEFGVRLLPIPLPYLTFHPALINYQFDYDPFTGKARISELGDGNPRGLANIPPPVLGHVFNQMMEFHGLNQDPGILHHDILNWIESRGLGPHVAMLQHIAATAEDEEVRARADAEVRNITRTIGTDLMILKFLRLKRDQPTGGADQLSIDQNWRVAVPDDDVEDLFNRRRAAYTVVNTDIVVYDSRVLADAAADRGTFDHDLRTQRLHNQHATEIEFAYGQPNLPPSLKVATYDMEVGDISKVIDLGGGKFGIVRVTGKREPTWETVSPAIKETLREELWLERSRENFNEHFNRWIGSQTDTVERGLHVYRGTVLEQQQTDYPWADVEAAMNPLTFADDEPLGAAHARTSAALETTIAALQAAREKIAGMRPALVAIEVGDEQRGTRMKMLEELDEWLGDIDARIAATTALMSRLQGANNIHALRRFEERRASVIEDSRKLFDQLTLGDSELEEYLFDLQEAEVEGLDDIIGHLGAAKLTPEVLVMTTYERPGQITDGAGRALVRAFHE